VRAINGIGPSGYSNPVDVATPDLPPVAPSNLRASGVTATQVPLTWTDKATQSRILKKWGPSKVWVGRSANPDHPVVPNQAQSQLRVAATGPSPPSLLNTRPVRVDWPTPRELAHLLGLRGPSSGG